jgi:hypothetical protein
MSALRCRSNIVFLRFMAVFLQFVALRLPGKVALL